MKQLRRAVILVCILLLCAGCAQTPSDSHNDPNQEETERRARVEQGYTLYSEAAENRRILASVDSTTTGTVTATVNGEAHDLRFTAELKLGGDPTAPLLYKHFTLTEAGSTVEYTQYYRDGKRYYHDEHQQYSENFTGDDATAMADQFSLVAMTAAAFRDVSVVAKSNNTQISVTVDSERIEDELLREDGLFYTLLGSTLPAGTQPTVTEAAVSFAVNGDIYFTDYTQSYTVEAGDSVYRVQLRTAIHHVAEAVTIEFPDFEEYTDKSKTPGNTLDAQALDALTSVMEELYTDTGERVEDFEARYAALCEQHEAAAVDAAIQWYDNYLRTQTVGAAS